MAGGTFISYNKVRAGVYINFRTADTAGASVGERGTAALPLSLGYGPAGVLIRVDRDTDVRKALGYSGGSDALLLLRECAKCARAVLVYRLNDGEKASGTGGGLTATARYGGSRGNDFTVKVAQEGEAFRVETWLDGELLDSQTVSQAGELAANDWLEFSGSALSAQAGIRLSGGSDEEADADDYAAFFKALETADFQTAAIPSSDAAVKQAAAAFVKRMREEEGVKVQVVAAEYPQADYEGVISVKNGVVLEDGTRITKEMATAYAAGMTAGAQVNQSNTYGVYDGAADVDERFTNSQIVEALKAGEWVFVPRDGGVVVEQDINTFTSHTPQKGAAFSKNRLVRVMDTLANDIKALFEGQYLGKVGNSADGRSLFQAAVAGYLEQLQAIGAIDAFDSREDIQVLPGESADAVVVNLAIRPVDSMEKLYMTVEIQ